MRSNGDVFLQDLWSAANWLVSALQATFATGVGLVGISRSGTDMLHIRLAFLRPFAWFSLGYWLYDLVCLFILVTREQLDEDLKKKNNNAAKAALISNSGGDNTSQKQSFSSSGLPPLIALPRSIVRFVCWWPGIVFHHLGIVSFLVVGILTTTRVQGDSIIGYSLLMELSSIFVALRYIKRNWNVFFLSF
jgi:hypothetical protein